MGVALQIQGMKVLQRNGRGSRVQLAVFRVAPECLNDLDIRQMWHVQPERWIGNPRGDCLSCRRVKQQLEDTPLASGPTAA